MPAILEPARSPITLRLLDHAEKNWPQLAKARARYHGSFASITGVLEPQDPRRTYGVTHLVMQELIMHLFPRIWMGFPTGRA
ncbi:MAG: hypothetical protein JO345_38345 [Streptosporangiaceae bacterium]|nr:hypothetical protein [Streptosporangiaceae bacterium]